MFAVSVPECPVSSDSGVRGWAAWDSARDEMGQFAAGMGHSGTAHGTVWDRGVGLGGGGFALPGEAGRPEDMGARFDVHACIIARMFCFDNKGMSGGVVGFAVIPAPHP